MAAWGDGYPQPPLPAPPTLGRFPLDKETVGWGGHPWGRGQHQAGHGVPEHPWGKMTALDPHGGRVRVRVTMRGDGPEARWAKEPEGTGTRSVTASWGGGGNDDDTGQRQLQFRMSWGS